MLLKAVGISVAILLLSFTVASPVFSQPSPPPVSCLLSAGSVIQVSAEICSKIEGAQILTDSNQSSDQAADKLYSTWEANNRTNHAVAHKAGKYFVAQFAKDPRASKVRSWINAYENVMISGAVAVPKPTEGNLPTEIQTPAGQTNAGPSLEETKKWIVDRLSKASIARPLARWLTVRFDGCTLQEKFVLRTERYHLIFQSEWAYPVIERTIHFDRLDPSSAHIYRFQRGTEDEIGGAFIDSGKKGFTSTPAVEVLFSNNDGTFNVPVVGSPADSSPLSAPLFPLGLISDRLLKGPFSITKEANGRANYHSVVFMTNTDEEAIKLSNALKRLTELCGGKMDLF